MLLNWTYAVLLKHTGYTCKRRHGNLRDGAFFRVPRRLQGKRFFHLVDIVELLPCEQLNGHCLVAVIFRVERLFYHLRLAAHVAIGCRFLIDGLTQLQPALDGCRTHIEDFAHQLRNLCVGKRHFGCAVGVHAKAHRLGYADGVSNLHKGLLGNACCHNVLGYVARGISCRTVNLRRVFARERSAAVRSTAAVSVNNYLAAGKSGVRRSRICRSDSHAVSSGRQTWRGSAPEAWR